MNARSDRYMSAWEHRDFIAEQHPPKRDQAAVPIGISLSGRYWAAIICPLALARAMDTGASPQCEAANGQGSRDKYSSKEVVRCDSASLFWVVRGSLPWAGFVI